MISKFSISSFYPPFMASTCQRGHGWRKPWVMWCVEIVGRISCFRSNQNKGDTRVTILHMIINPWENTNHMMITDFQDMVIFDPGVPQSISFEVRKLSVHSTRLKMSVSVLPFFWEKGKVFAQFSIPWHVSEDDSDDSLSILSFKTHLPSSSRHASPILKSTQGHHQIGFTQTPSHGGNGAFSQLQKDIKTSLVLGSTPKLGKPSNPPPMDPPQFLPYWDQPWFHGKIPGVGLVRANLCDGRVPLMPTMIWHRKTKPRRCFWPHH